MKLLSALFLFAVLLSPSSLLAAELQSGLSFRSSAEYGLPIMGSRLSGPSRVGTGGRPSARSIDKKSKEWKNDIRSIREDHFESIGIPQRRRRSRFKRESAYLKKPVVSPAAE